MKPALDFSILDRQQPIEMSRKPTKMPFNVLQDVRQYKTTPESQPISNRTLDILNDVQTSKIEISQGIRAGTDPYSLLLKAVQLISTLTGEQDFYTIHRDVMQGMGMLKQIPPEWERNAINTSLHELRTCRRNIDNAIKMHQQRLDGEALDSDIDPIDEYDRRIEKCFEAAYEFLEKNKYVRTDEDWERVAKNSTPYVDPFTVDLIVAVVYELEREHKSFTGK